MQIVSREQIEQTGRSTLTDVLRNLSANAGNSFYGLAIGFTVTVGAFTVGRISGAVFNPAVAAGLVTIGGFPPLSSWTYYISELGGGVVAGLVFQALNVNPETKEVTKRKGLSVVTQ